MEILSDRGLLLKSLNLFFCLSLEIAFKRSNIGYINEIL